MPPLPPSPPNRPGLPCAPEEFDDFLGRPTPGAVAAVARAEGPFLVLGAGGKMGLHLAVMLRRALDQLGRQDRVVAASRFTSLRDSESFSQRGIETIRCDLSVDADLQRLPEAPTVFFLAGVKFGTAAAPGLLHATNVELPRRVAQRFAASRVVVFSSGNIYPFVTPESGGAREDTPPAPVGDYAVSCLAREHAFAEISATRRTPVALFRLNYAVEFRYGLLVDIAQAVLAGRPVDVTTGHVNVIWQTDAVAHSIQALEIAATPAQPINVTGPAVLSVRNLAARFGAAMDQPVHLTGQEAATAWLSNATRSHALFGPPATPVDRMIAWIAAWLTQGGGTWGKPTGFGHRDGKF